jgi:quercetin dioxygenase-like cupin family protein
MDDATAVVLGPGEGETVRNPVGGTVTFKARGAETGGALAVFESEIAAGDGPPLHVHSNEEEVLYVLEGTFRFQLADAVHAAPQGSVMVVRRGAPHCFQNAGEAPGRLLIVFTPAGMDRFFGLTGGDRSAFEVAAAEVGMEVVGPPLR